MCTHNIAHKRTPNSIQPGDQVTVFRGHCRCTRACTSLIGDSIEKFVLTTSYIARLLRVHTSAVIVPSNPQLVARKAHAILFVLGTNHSDTETVRKGSRRNFFDTEKVMNIHVACKAHNIIFVQSAEPLTRRQSGRAFDTQTVRQ